MGVVGRWLMVVSIKDPNQPATYTVLRISLLQCFMHLSEAYLDVVRRIMDVD